MRGSSLLLMLIAALQGAAPLIAAQDEPAHPLFSKYPGSILSRHDAKEFDEYRLIVGLEDDAQPRGPSLEGKVSRFYYNNPRGRSTLEIFRNYKQAFLGEGIEVLFECANDECGPGYAASAWSRFNGITTKSGADCRYFAGKLTTEGGETYVAVMVGRTRHQVDILEVTGMETSLVTVNAEALAASIDRTGRATVYGIYFDTGSSTIKPESRAALDEIAKLLEGRPDLAVYVVGHTDDVGGFEMNMELSQLRAEAVVQALVDQYGIDAARLDGHGVGPLAPAAPNTGDEGRAKNRRVELVRR